MDIVMNPGASLFALLMLALLIWSLFWVYGDATARGKSGALIALLVLLLAAIFLICALIPPFIAWEFNRQQTA